ncbi:MAG: trypsin-like peptidase domain-containing protein [Candidatus Zixiibacteriota bacterium]
MIGILISSALDFSPLSVAQGPTNITQSAAYPVVERDGELESPFVAVVEKVQSAVVNISARTKEERLPWWFHAPDYTTSYGSGFFFREDGYILTNNHVVQNAERLKVVTASGYEYDAELVGADSETDLAVLKVEPEEKVVTIPFGDSDAIKVGDWAIAIGNPFPQQGLDRTVTVGVISAKGRGNLFFGRETPSYQDYIQTDASINPGNSGGPLLNLRGEAIGVNAAISTPSGGSVGIGFAIPINLARAVVPDLIAYGKPHRGWLGVWLSHVTEKEARRQGLEAVKGVMIDSVLYNSPAERAGIRPGDIIVGFNNQPVENPQQLSVLVSTTKSGKPVPINIVRNGKQLSLTATIADRDTYLASLKDYQKSESDDFPVYRWMGMELMTFTHEIAQALSMEYVEGVYVRRVEAGSGADRSSIAAGTIILQINKVPTKSVEDVQKVVEELKDRVRRIPLIVQEPDGIIARKVIRL